MFGFCIICKAFSAVKIVGNFKRLLFVILFAGIVLHKFVIPCNVVRLKLSMDLLVGRSLLFPPIVGEARVIASDQTS